MQIKFSFLIDLNLNYFLLIQVLARIRFIVYFLLYICKFGCFLSTKRKLNYLCRVYLIFFKKGNLSHRKVFYYFIYVRYLKLNFVCCWSCNKNQKFIKFLIKFKKIKAFVKWKCQLIFMLNLFFCNLNKILHSALIKKSSNSILAINISWF